MRAQYSKLATEDVSMQLKGKNFSTVGKNIDSCDSKEYTENNISLICLTLSRLGAGHMAKEKIHVLWCDCAEVVNLWVWLPFHFVSHFVSFLDLLAPRCNLHLACCEHFFCCLFLLAPGVFCYVQPTMVSLSSQKLSLLLHLLVCGDVDPNHGPVCDACSNCDREVAFNHLGLLCEMWSNWSHHRPLCQHQHECRDLNLLDQKWVRTWCRMQEIGIKMREACWKDIFWCIFLVADSCI